ncbi:hypothetical protein TNCV_1022211 [Trichonephila clavipes]|nr:hypothetical protein TNCV_1022211 [Trichonephila clavipes]
MPRVQDLVALKTCRLEGLMHVKSVVTQSPYLGLEGSKESGVPAQESFYSLDHGSQIRDSPSIPLALL